jgi:hypothetical protein
MNFKIFVLTFFLVGMTLKMEAQVVYFNGLGRVIVTNDKLNGAVLDSTATHTKDTLSGRKSTGGYTLFDLGINIQPNENLRGSVILRVRNEFGGFYGQGVSLGFRQLRLEGVAAKRIKYQLGDIDLGLTPYTIYNPDEIYNTFEADVFKMRRQIVHYENFNFDNKWRVQGGDLYTHLVFTKGIEKIKFRLLGARIKKSNQTVNIPDRVFYGGRTEIVQSKFLQIGGNYIETTDLEGTVPDTVVSFKDRVITGDWRLSYDLNKIQLCVIGEAGTSNYNYFQEVQNKTVTHRDYFYDIGLSSMFKSIGLKFTASYRNVGPEFLNPVAQTRRIFDFGTPTLFGTLQNLNDPYIGNVRVPTLFDRYSQEGLYNQSISTVLMPYLPQYNNVTPYGFATPNRKGFTFALEKSDTSNILRGELKTEILSEAVGEGTVDKRNFISVRGGVKVNIDKIIKSNRDFGFNVGARYENTKRANSIIDLTSLLIDAGINFEVVKSLNLLVGYKLLNASGVEFISQRDDYNSLTSTPLFFDIDETQGIMAAGIRYDFSKNSFFTAQGHWVNFNNNKNTTLSYGLNQLFFNYTIVF